MIKTGLENVDLIGGYLHDATFFNKPLDFDDAQHIFRLRLTRICYEKPSKTKILKLIPVTRFPWIDSWLSVSEVSSVEYDGRGDLSATPDGGHMLLDISEAAPSVVKLKASSLRIRLNVAPSATIAVEDIPDSVTEYTVTDFGKGVFRSMDEIERLRERR